MKLSNESIQKIVKEIVDNSSMRNNQIDKDKLIKLIMGFSNLLIGKTKLPSFNGDSSNSYGDSYRYYPVAGNNVFRQEEQGKKVFNIEKTRKNKTCSASTSESSQNHFLIEKTKKVEQNGFPAEIKTNNFQISNHNDLLKLLLQQQPQNVDLTNPNKNVINIISINICNKNGEPIQLNNGNNQNYLNNLKIIGNTQAPLSEISTFNATSFDKESFQKSVISRDSLNNSAATSESPSNEKMSFFDNDFYEGDSSSSIGFNPNNVDEEVDKYFNW